MTLRVLMMKAIQRHKNRHDNHIRVHQFILVRQTNFIHPDQPMAKWLKGEVISISDDSDTPVASPSEDLKPEFVEGSSNQPCTFY